MDFKCLVSMACVTFQKMNGGAYRSQCKAQNGVDKCHGNQPPSYSSFFFFSILFSMQYKIK